MKKIQYTYLITAIILTIPLIVWVFLFNNFMFNKNLADNGTKTVATITSTYSNIEINEEPYYNFKFEFYDEDGNLHTGKSGMVYSYYEIQNMHNVLISYDKNFNAVEVNFEYKNMPELWILPIFGIIGIWFWVLLIRNIYIGKLEKKIIEFGTEKTACYIGGRSYMSVNNQAIYYIEYQYKDENEVLVTKKTSSKYTNEEKEYYEFLGEFKIKEYKGKTVITEIIDLEKMYKELEQKTNEEAEKEELLRKSLELKLCTYCGSKISINDKKCPNCGSSKFERTEN